VKAPKMWAEVHTHTNKQTNKHTEWTWRPEVLVKFRHACQLALASAPKQDAMNSDMNLIAQSELFQFPCGRHAWTELNTVM